MAAKLLEKMEESPSFLNLLWTSDLSPPDFYLWGYLRSKVYANKPTTISELKVATRDEIRAIPRSVCKDVMKNFVKRLEKCLELNSGHLEHVM